VLVAECIKCSRRFYARTPRMLERDMILHYSVHFCEERFEGVYRNVYRNICVSTVFKMAKHGFDVRRFYRVFEIS